MHQKTVYTIISLKLKEIECPCHRPPSSLPFMTNAKKGHMLGAQNQREKCHFVVVDGDDDDFKNGK